MIPFNLVGGFQCFERTYCFDLQGREPYSQHNSIHIYSENCFAKKLVSTYYTGGMMQAG
jgi:hypothetical protein